MSQHIVSIPIPQYLYDRIQQAAKTSQRSVEKTLVDSLDLLFGDNPDMDVDSFETFTDDQLWAMCIGV
jgi:hypothetical protein